MQKIFEFLFGIEFCFIDTFVLFQTSSVIKSNPEVNIDKFELPGSKNI